MREQQLAESGVFGTPYYARMWRRGLIITVFFIVASTYFGVTEVLHRDIPAAVVSGVVLLVSLWALTVGIKSLRKHENAKRNRPYGM